MHPSLNIAFLIITTHSHDHILTLSNRIDEKHRVYAHDTVREMGPSEGHGAGGAERGGARALRRYNINIHSRTVVV